MAATPKVLFRGAATLTTTTTLYTVPAATTTIVNSLVVSNTDTVSQTFTMSFAGTKLAETVAIAPNSLVAFDFKQALSATNTIQGGASSTNITFHITGVEVA